MLSIYIRYTTIYSKYTHSDDMLPYLVWKRNQRNSLREYFIQFANSKAPFNRCHCGIAHTHNVCAGALSTHSTLEISHIISNASRFFELHTAIAPRIDLCQPRTPQRRLTDHNFAHICVFCRCRSFSDVLLTSSMYKLSHATRNMNDSCTLSVTRLMYCVSNCLLNICRTIDQRNFCKRAGEYARAAPCRHNYICSRIA